MIVAPLDEARLPAWAALFEACHAPCFCRFWQFEGDKNAWLARCAFEPETNRDEQSALVRAGDAAAGGLLALEGDRAIGWMKLAPRRTLAKLRRQGAYRALDLGDDEGVFAIGCVLVDPEHRRRGVARALVAAAPAHVRSRGGRVVEAYPRHSEYALRDDEMAAGPEALFQSLGFERFAGESAYPVYRLTVS